ncbi:MAG: hypothetical protein GY823_12045, partial [Flavobacteriaceae bacterium]|nr:hypothetical protein [Flavobacteriaceae bacterium]
MNGKDLLIEIEENMNSYDKYAEDNYCQTDTRNFELEQLNSQIESKAQKRKDTPVFSGVLKYFPNALKEVAKCSKAGND